MKNVVWGLLWALGILIVLTALMDCLLGGSS